MKSKLMLTAVIFAIIGSLALPAVPAESYRMRPFTPGPCFIDEDKDGVCDHAQSWMSGGKGQKDEKPVTAWNCPRMQGKGHGWGMKGGKICPNLPDGGNSPSGGVTK